MNADLLSRHQANLQPGDLICSAKLRLWCQKESGQGVLDHAGPRPPFKLQLAVVEGHDKIYIV